MFRCKNHYQTTYFSYFDRGFYTRTPVSNRSSQPVTYFKGYYLPTHHSETVRFWQCEICQSSEYGGFSAVPGGNLPTNFFCCFLAPGRNELADVYGGSSEIAGCMHVRYQTLSSQSIPALVSAVK